MAEPASLVCPSIGWLVERLTSPFSTKIGYIGNNVLGGDLVPPVKDGQ